MFPRILLAADGSQHSLRAAEQAAALSSLSGESQVTIVYVVDGQKSKEDVLHHFDKSIVSEVRMRRLQPVEEILNEKKCAYKIEMLHGDPGPAIVDYANKQHFDLVVVGSRGLNGLQEMVLGSVSHKVAKRVKAPVMIVK